MRYNKEQKLSFINYILENNKSYSSAYERLFDMTSEYEESLNKDLAQFTQDDLMVVFKDIAPSIKYTTVLTYNSLVKDYKDWIKFNNGKVVDEICGVDRLKKIKNFKKYVIFNEGDILNITKFLSFDGGDYNIALSLKLFWDIDGQEDLLDVLKLRLEDIDRDSNTVVIHRTEYKNVIIDGKRTKVHIGTKGVRYTIDSWTIQALLDYASMTSLQFKNKEGSYAILDAEQNDGLIFRMTYTKRTKVGEPLDGVKFSNTLYQFCVRNRMETITINDILMSLALRYMVQHKKSPAQMYTEKRYFANLPSSVYADVLQEHGRIKYSEEFAEYVNHYQILEKKYSQICK